MKLAVNHIIVMDDPNIIDSSEDDYSAEEEIEDYSTDEAAEAHQEQAEKPEEYHDRTEDREKVENDEEGDLEAVTRVNEKLEASNQDADRAEKETYDDIFRYLSTGSYPQGATKAEKGVLRRRSKSYQVVDGILHYKGKKGELKQVQYCISNY